MRWSLPPLWLKRSGLLRSVVTAYSTSTLEFRFLTSSLVMPQWESDISWTRHDLSNAQLQGWYRITSARQSHRSSRSPYGWTQTDERWAESETLIEYRSVWTCHGFMQTVNSAFFSVSKVFSFIFSPRVVSYQSMSLYFFLGYPTSETGGSRLNVCRRNLLLSIALTALAGKSSWIDRTRHTLVVQRTRFWAKVGLRMKFCVFSPIVMSLLTDFFM